MKTLYLIRGLSGSGKSTLAYIIEAGVPDDCHMNGVLNAKARVYSADDFFYHDGEYAFDPKLLPAAHADCQAKAGEAMSMGVEAVIVANTFSQAWEAEAYFEMATKFRYSVFVIECQNSFKNIHDVPEETIEAMKDRWEPLR